MTKDVKLSKVEETMTIVTTPVKIFEKKSKTDFKVKSTQDQTQKKGKTEFERT